jgi:hypothetical protein
MKEASSRSTWTNSVRAVKPPELKASADPKFCRTAVAFAHGLSRLEVLTLFRRRWVAAWGAYKFEQELRRHQWICTDDSHWMFICKEFFIILTSGKLRWLCNLCNYYCLSFFCLKSFAGPISPLRSRFQKLGAPQNREMVNALLSLDKRQSFDQEGLPHQRTPKLPWSLTSNGRSHSVNDLGLWS